MMTALVVEDSPTMRKLIVLGLERVRRLRVIEAVDGVDAVKLLATQPVDIVVTDLNMPIMDGLKLVSFVRKLPAHALTPIILVSSEAAFETRDRAIAAGANAFVTKPLHMPELVERVEALLAPRRRALNES
jgi:two-component system, chemotaxis family, chemotaxis protein CheY